MGLRWSWTAGWLLSMDGVLEPDSPFLRDDFRGCHDVPQSFPQERLTHEPACTNVGSASTWGLASQVSGGVCGLLADVHSRSDHEKRANCANTGGGEIKEFSGNSEEGVDQSQILNTQDDSEAMTNLREKKIGEDFVSKLKGVTQNFLSCWIPNFHNKVIRMK